ncbi:hypothetical protein NEOLEDRAFT_963595 [Neolentinus lepideus HHB14362 ss-1]|uniref:t-SNARE coiled-coil homology domain-containing protein n=1 Tax=Neolentinus lepideus HHB14362 ss-1 TaxID=1314782 RepID=A0A165UHC5_9AGAM|nr:hypothetical protein NEOLEDRAFT_963595 [Neolentinus lepideus HHB14362 ss-1]
MTLWGLAGSKSGGPASPLASSSSLLPFKVPQPPTPSGPAMLWTPASNSFPSSASLHMSQEDARTAMLENRVNAFETRMVTIRSEMLDVCQHIAMLSGTLQELQQQGASLRNDHMTDLDSVRSSLNRVLDRLWPDARHPHLSVLLSS